jgi:hypothetical protein
LFVKTGAEDFPTYRASLRQKIEDLSLKGLPGIPLGHASVSGYLIRLHLRQL